MKTYIEYINGEERGIIKTASHNAAEKKAKVKFSKEALMPMRGIGISRHILPSHFDVDFINKVFYPSEYKNNCLGEINSGRCYDWAYLAYCLWENTKLWSSDIHAWIMYKGLFFDSESPHGVTSFNELNCNAIHGDLSQEDPCEMQAEKFKNHWNMYGGGRRFHWNELELRIRSLGLTVLR